MDWRAIAGEGLKMLVQLGGALLIARLTVYWALRRFKSERAWERQSTALADLFHALSEIDECNYAWVREAQVDGTPNSEWSAEMRARYQAASRKMTAVGSIAPLIFSPAISRLIEEYEGKILQPFENDEPWIDHIIRQQKFVEDERNAIAAAVRAEALSSGNKEGCHH